MEKGLTLKTTLPSQFKMSTLAITCIVLSACSSHYQMPTALKQQTLNSDTTPESWSIGAQKSKNLISEGTFQELNDDQIRQLVNRALSNNLQLQQQNDSLKIKEQAVIASGSNLWPSLEAGLTTGRSKSVNPSSISNKFDADITLRYELDLWQKLAASDKKANLEYLAEQALFEEAKQALIANVVLAWFDVIEANKLLSLYSQRIENAKQNLSIIESGYQQGLNGALDVYLARNELHSEESRLALQQTTQSTAIRALERLIGEYPAALLEVNANIPTFKSSLDIGIPSELIKKKPSLKASWYQLMAKDAGLAFAHKQRFPSFVLSASTGDSAARFSELFSASGLAWNLVGNLTAPLFEGGRIKANERSAEFQLQQAEKKYLDDIYSAFENVENTLSAQRSLVVRYESTKQAMENAVAAEKLAFEQYQSGLVTYTTVLDAQSRAFDAQSSLIQIKKQRAANRIQLQLQLGTAFIETNNNTSTGDTNND